MAPPQLMALLHAHLPYVADGPEQDWLFEAMAETYVPLLATLERMQGHCRGPLLALSFSPVLCEMLAADQTHARLGAYLDERIAAAGAAVASAGSAEEAGAARFYVGLYERTQTRAASLTHRGLLGAFRDLEAGGVVELLTTAATHALLPLLANSQSVRAQLATAREAHQRHFGKPPRGLWLPECGYAPGLEEAAAAEGFDYLFLAGHGVLDADPRPQCGPFAPVVLPNRVAAFPLDADSGQRVWNRHAGYPGSPWYREFHRDLGFERARPRRRGIGLHRVTGDVPLHEKAWYDPQHATDQARLDAGDFVRYVQEQAHALAGELGVAPLVTVAFDAELFGHWWLEGVDFLEAVLRGLSEPDDAVSLATPSEFLARAGRLQRVQPAASTWGRGGYFATWLDPSNDWIYPLLHRAEERLIELANGHNTPDALLRRALNQAARELMLAQSSDWPFMMSQGDKGEYAARRIRQHLDRFESLAQQISSAAVDVPGLRGLEAKDTVFPQLDYRLWATR